MSSLKVGAGKIIITPPIGDSIDQQAFGSKGVDNDIYARALVFDDGKEKAVLIVCDLLSVRKDLVVRVRKHVTEITGIPSENVMIAATHTHSGARDSCSTDPDWVSTLSRHIAGSAYIASQNKKGCKIGIGSGLSQLGINRRNPLGEKPYWLTPWIHGIIDHEVTVMRVNDLENKPVAVLVNYASHPNVFGWKIPRINRGFPGYTVDLIEETFREGVVGIYLSGTCGNVGPKISWDSPIWSEKTPPSEWQKLQRRPSWPLLIEEEKRLGTILGAEAIEIALDIKDFTTDTKLLTRTVKQKLFLRKDIPKEFERRLKLNSFYLSSTHLQSINKKMKFITSEIQAFSLGDVGILGLPGEVFVEFGLQIKKSSPFQRTFITELANDSISYVPTTKAFKEGGYEPNTCILSPISGDQLMKKALELLEDLKSESMTT